MTQAQVSSRRASHSNGNDEIAAAGTILARLPARSGTYFIVLRCAAPYRRHIGALGSVRIRKGYYIYVGSAQGPGGIQARLGRHLLRSQKVHWHIDYLRRHLPVIAFGYLESTSVLEHEWARILAHCPRATTGIPRFGSSDCRCPSHLFHVETRSQLDEIYEHLENRSHPTLVGVERVKFDGVTQTAR